MDVVTTYNMGHKISKWKNVMMTLLNKPYLQNFLIVKGRKWYKILTWNFDMALDLDKYTSWCDPCIDVILDSDLYTSISWVGSLYKHCELEVPITICNIANEVWINLLHAYTFTRVINDKCWWLSWSNNICIMTVDKRSIEIYIVQKIIPLWWEGIWIG